MKRASLILLACGLLALLVEIIVYDPAYAFPGLYALAGFGFYTLIVLTARLFRLLVMRPENYYAEDAS